MKDNCNKKTTVINKLYYNYGFDKRHLERVL